MQWKHTERAKEVSFDHRAGRLIRRKENGRGNQVLMFPTLPGRGTLRDFTQNISGVRGGERDRRGGRRRRRRRNEKRLK